MTISVNGKQATSARLFAPWRGVWFVEVELPLEGADVPPTGRAALVIGEESFVGTVFDPLTGKSGPTARVRIVGGAGGWEKDVKERHFKNDAGVRSSNVFAATASEVLETVIDAEPFRYGPDYVRTAGKASRVFRGLEWHVGFDGVTKTGERPLVEAPESLRVLEWDAATQSGTVVCDTVIVPGTRITDDRFGSVIVRDVEQTFDVDGARARVWCSGTPKARVASALAAIARESIGLPYLKVYKYRIVDQGSDGRIRCQIVSKTNGVPDLVAITSWPGMAGLDATHTAGAEVLVEFLAGDPAHPVARGWSTAPPQKLKLSATSAIEAGGTTPVVLATSALSTWISSVTAAVNGLAPSSVSPLLPTAYSASKLKGG